jgi:GNAT superfamily N-acetyltransferase
MRMHRASWTLNFPNTPYNERLLSGILHGVGTQRVHIYEQEGEFVGWLWLEAQPGAEGHVRHVQVLRERWGEGLGRRIMLDAIELCRAAHCRRLTLNVTKANARARSLYASLGFKISQDRGTRQSMVLSLSESPEHER